jgi:RNA polymerase sigma-70 factor (ECF subfamily)
MNPDPDAELMVRLLAGDDAALNQLIDRWQKPLVSFILRYVGNEADSIELAQETFVRFYQNRSRFNFKSKFSTWLFTIASNLARNHVRWNKTHKTVLLENASGVNETSDEDFAGPIEETPSALVERAEIAHLVREAIQALPHDLKTAILLYEYEDFSYDIIAGILGCSPKAVETRLYRARKLLRKKLDNIYLTDKGHD